MYYMEIIDNDKILSYFKHNNYSFLQQGAVTSSSRIQRLKYNTLYTNIPSNATNKPIIINKKPKNFYNKTPEGTRNNFKPRYNPACSINKIVPNDYNPCANCIFKPTTSSQLRKAVSDYIKGSVKYGNIKNWDTSLITDMSYLFFGKQKFNEDISGWDTSNVTSMSNMFNGASCFNIDISSWNTKNVQDMSFMFKNAVLFNKDIGIWNVVKVDDMTSMFENAYNFNRYIRYWIVGSLTTLTNMFLNANAMIEEYTGTKGFAVTPFVSFFHVYLPGVTIYYPPFLPPQINILEYFPPYAGPPKIQI